MVWRRPLDRARDLCCYGQPADRGITRRAGCKRDRFLAWLCARHDLHQSHPGHLLRTLHLSERIDLGFCRPVRVPCRLVTPAHGGPVRGPDSHPKRTASAWQPSGDDLCRAHPNHVDRARDAGHGFPLARQLAPARVAQRGRRVLQPGQRAHRASLPHASARLFRHSAALRRADGDGTRLRAHPPLCAALAATRLVVHLSRHARFPRSGRTLLCGRCSGPCSAPPRFS